MGLVVFIWIIFIAWLMWSDTSAKEMFLFYAWTTMLVVGILGAIYEWVT